MLKPIHFMLHSESKRTLPYQKMSRCAQNLKKASLEKQIYFKTENLMSVQKNIFYRSYNSRF